MRLHRLEVQAFGPFAERAVVDLDAVSSGGLFLVHGPTGSGKTSLLDAVCFALYADVPGARHKQGLRSDHAPPEVPPEVVLELTVGGRRLRLTRSPAWNRPKRRGSGTTPVQARVLLEEQVCGSWTALSTRNDEVADVATACTGRARIRPEVGERGRGRVRGRSRPGGRCAARSEHHRHQHGARRDRRHA